MFFYVGGLPHSSSTGSLLEIFAEANSKGATTASATAASVTAGGSGSGSSSISSPAAAIGDETHPQQHPVLAKLPSLPSSIEGVSSPLASLASPRGGGGAGAFAVAGECVECDIVFLLCCVCSVSLYVTSYESQALRTR